MAVDHEGEVLESYVTTTRDKAAALKFIKKVMKRHGRPEAIVTDGLRSYGAALRQIDAADRQETGRWKTTAPRTAERPGDDLDHSVVDPRPGGSGVALGVTLGVRL